MVDISCNTSFLKVTWEAQLKRTIFVTYDAGCDIKFSVAVGRLTNWRRLINSSYSS